MPIFALNWFTAPDASPIRLVSPKSPPVSSL